MPERRRRPARAWLRWAIPAFGVVAAAAIALLVVRPSAPRDERVATVKGAGEVVIDLVRDREGAIGMGATTFRAGDRWKVVVTCAPGAATWVDVAVVEQGSPVAVGPDYPLAPVRLACGNRVVVPGAFVLTGGRPNRVCAVMGADAAPARDGGDVPSGEGVACVMVRPEKP